MKGGMMKTYFLSLLTILALVFITCGNEPPEEFYEGTPEDSTAIHALLDQNPELLVTDDLFISDYIAVAMDSVEFFVADSYFRDIDTIVKIHVDSTGVSWTDSCKQTLDFWFAKDTTCTVYIIDTFEVVSLMHYDEKRIGYYFWGGDTGIQLDTVIIDSTPSYDEQYPFGNGQRHIFFDPVRDTVVDEETGDTLYPVREPHEFALKRISYGTYNFPASGTDIPIIDQVDLTYQGDTGVVHETIIRSSYDTTYTGHVMNRFRAIDSLLEIPAGETLGVELILAFGQVTADMCLFYTSCGGSNRVELDGGVGSLVADGSGITNIYFEAVVDESYYYMIPDKDYKAQVWLIPVRIQ